MKIYILERDNPEIKLEPQIFKDVKYANVVMQCEYREILNELRITPEDIENETGDYSCYYDVNEETLCGEILISDDYTSDHWEWRLTEHELPDHFDTVFFCPQCRSVIDKEIRSTSDNGARQWVMDICDAVEDVLEEYDVTVPDDDRTGDQCEARLYGAAFDKVANAVTDILMVLEAEMKMNPSKVYDFTVY